MTEIRFYDTGGHSEYVGKKVADKVEETVGTLTGVFDLDENFFDGIEVYIHSDISGSLDQEGNVHLSDPVSYRDRIRYLTEDPNFPSPDDFALKYEIAEELGHYVMGESDNDLPLRPSPDELYTDILQNDNGEEAGCSESLETVLLDEIGAKLAVRGTHPEIIPHTEEMIEQNLDFIDSVYSVNKDGLEGLPDPLDVPNKYSAGQNALPSPEEIRGTSSSIEEAKNKIELYKKALMVEWNAHKIAVQDSGKLQGKEPAYARKPVKTLKETNDTFLNRQA